MGGSNSGRHGGKGTTRGRNTLDVRKLQRDGVLIPGSRFTSSWTRNGKPNGSISVIVNQLQGTNPVLDKLTHKTFIDAKFHDADDTVKGNIRAQLAIELQNKMQQSNATE